MGRISRKFQSESWEGGNHMEDLEIDEKILLKGGVKKYGGGGVWT